MTGSSKVLTGDAVAKKPTAHRTPGPLLRGSWGVCCGIGTTPPAPSSSSVREGAELDQLLAER
jgi:hypothetical protein